MGALIFGQLVAFWLPALYDIETRMVVDFQNPTLHLLVNQKVEAQNLVRFCLKCRLFLIE